MQTIVEKISEKKEKPAGVAIAVPVSSKDTPEPGQTPKAIVVAAVSIPHTEVMGGGQVPYTLYHISQGGFRLYG